MENTKYPRTYHIPGSPGTTSDDRIATHVEGLLHVPVCVQEKLDGEGACLNRYGVFARSHAAPTEHPWSAFLRQRWQLIKNQMGSLAVYGENLYAIHSISYSRLEEHFFVFGMKDLDTDTWLSWEEVCFYARILEFSTVPVLEYGVFETPAQITACIARHMAEPSVFSDDAIYTSPKEGLVLKRTDAFAAAHFSQSVLKWVRKGHVQTDQHWTRNWKRAPLHHELLSRISHGNTAAE